jgi:hypothetical protein
VDPRGPGRSPVVQHPFAEAPYGAVVTRSGSRGRRGPAGHRWAGDACRRCGLRRREEWLLDDQSRPVLALVWTDRYGDRRVQPFPPMLGLEPERRPTMTLVQAFPGLTVGPEPACEPDDD